MVASFGSGLVGGFVAGVMCPGIIRRVRAFVFGAVKKAESTVNTVKSDVKKL